MYTSNRARLTVMALAGASLIGMAALPARAQSELGYDAEAPVSEVLLEDLRQNANREEYIARIMQPLRQFDKDGDGLSQSDIEKQRLTIATRERARNGQQFLSMDFNNDLQVDAAEIESFSEGDATRRKANADSFMRRYDTNKDGVAQLEEALAIEPNRHRFRNHQRVEALINLDPNGDGRLTRTELVPLAEAAFDYFDRDASGTISPTEYQQVRAEQELARKIRLRRQAGCFFQPPSPNARFIAYSPYGAQTISSVFVGGPQIETGVVDVTIAPGDTPLYLVLSTYDSVIWRFSGATDRVERLIAASFASKNRRARQGENKTSAVGVIGLERSVVRITNPFCLPRFTDQREIEAGVPQIEFAALLGREPDEIARENPIGRLSVPELKMERYRFGQKLKVMDGFDPTIWEDALGFHPGGFEFIDANDVISEEPVGDYDVLPNKFGLAKLVAEGALSFEGSSSHNRKFTLLKPISRWPAEQNGALSTSFVKPDDIPMPEGSLGHSCVMTPEVAAKPNWERLCNENRGGGPPPPVLPPRPVRPARN